MYGSVHQDSAPIPVILDANHVPGLESLISRQPGTYGRMRVSRASSSPLFDSRLTPNFYLRIQALTPARPSSSVQLYPSDVIPACAPASSGSIENPIVLPVPRGALLMLRLPIAAWSKARTSHVHPLSTRAGGLRKGSTSLFTTLAATVAQFLHD